MVERHALVGGVGLRCVPRTEIDRRNRRGRLIRATSVQPCLETDPHPGGLETNSATSGMIGDDLARWSGESTISTWSASSTGFTHLLFRFGDAAVGPEAVIEVHDKLPVE